jgi:DNA mismatch repair protein MutS2
MYRLNVGIPGSSNAIDIAKTLGIEEEIISSAIKELSGEKIGFENVLKKAEEERRKYSLLSEELSLTLNAKKQELNNITLEKEKITATTTEVLKAVKIMD